MIQVPNTQSQEGGVFELTAEGFIAWLQGFEPGDIVGLPRDAENCPLTAYLEPHIGYGVEVSREAIHLSGKHPVPTPLWVKDFLACADLEQVAVTAGKALRFMAYAVHGYSLRGKRSNMYQKKNMGNLATIKPVVD